MILRLLLIICSIDQLTSSSRRLRREKGKTHYVTHSHGTRHGPAAVVTVVVDPTI